ncbi:NAD-binding protein [Propionibacteriaceae bacterium Y1700]|uniref:NAD-binding protein n=1 Tax=Microlunatus sp. Y1700 TaxID=3418487 RepID=UPI003DA74494
MTDPVPDHPTPDPEPDVDVTEQSSLAEASGHVVVIGANSTAQRLVEELERAGERVAVIMNPDTDPDVVHEMQLRGAETVLDRRTGERALTLANIDTARAAVIFGNDDIFIIRTALAIEERNPEARLVLELANPNLGRRLPGLLGECVVLSSAELAAPSFVTAALATDDVTTFEIGGRLVVAGPRDRVAGDHLGVLADSRREGDEALLPDGDGDVVLGTQLVGSSKSSVKTSGLRGVLAHVFDTRIRWIIMGLAILLVLSVLYFKLVGLDWLSAFFLALDTSAATGLGDVDSLPIGWRIGSVLIALFGLVLSSGVTAAILDVLISSRLAALTGGVRGKPRNHVIVCGLGRVGISVVARLAARDIPVVAIEANEDAVGVRRARRLKIPVIIAEGSDTSALETAGVAEAAVVLAVTNDDGANLEIGLAAKDTQPAVRVVTRLFDHDLAHRVERRLELGTSRSVSMLAAPSFAAAALGRREEVVLPVGRRVLLFTEVVVAAGSPAVGLPLSVLAETGLSGILAVRPDGGRWEWNWVDRPIAVGDRLAVVANRSGLARVLLSLKPGARMPDRTSLPLHSEQGGVRRRRRLVRRHERRPDRMPD